MSIDTQSKVILSKYEAYDCLNAGRERPLIKILVSYIKQSFLFKSSILTPIHLGRAVENETSKDGLIPEGDLKWLHENCIGDDDFEGHISNVNRRVGFFTGTYWAWKNYERLGNPDWFGSFGYRKLLVAEFLREIESADIWTPYLEDFGFNTMKEQMCDVHGEAAYAAMVEAVKTIHPGDIDALDRYMSMRIGAYHELYVMRSNVFFDFCEWIYPLMNFFLTHYESFIGVPCEIYKAKNLGIVVKEPIKVLLNEFMDKNVMDNYVKQDFSPSMKDRRDIAFIMERLTGFYLYKCYCNPNLKVKNCAKEVVAECTLRSAVFETMRKRVRGK